MDQYFLTFFNMNTFMLMGLVIQILILPASVMGYISAGQYMRDSSKLIKNDSKVNKKMWILVVISRHWV